MNKANHSEAILNVLKTVINKDDRRLLEIGAGTGQHAIYLAAHFPQIQWFPTELSKNILHLKKCIGSAPLSNLQIPTVLDVAKDDFPKLKFDVVFTANTLHAMHWKECKSLFKLLGNRLREGSRAIFYGPLKYNNEFKSIDHQNLDQLLKEQDSMSGIRSFEDVNKAMEKSGFELLQDIDMPDSNQLLIYNRLKFVNS